MRKLILITNDDGISAKGIQSLIRFLRPLGELLVVAPDSAKSGQSCALTVTAPVHYRQRSAEEGLTVYDCSGTPVDCVKIARGELLQRPPDLLISGINHGDNSATSVHYSGTMGAVIEGCLNGIPSIGFSLCDHRTDACFEPLKEWIIRITEKILNQPPPPSTCLNVNFPQGENYRGLRVCEQAKGIWESEWEPCPRQADKNYFWLAGSFVPAEPENEKTDYWALENGYVAVTPVTIDATAYDYMKTLDKLLR
jgi:5'-nucleotidase